MAAHSSEILLLNPPFGTLSKPYISIPVLASYLRERQIPVAAYDLNQEFYVRLLTPHNILKGLRASKERFLELNDRPELTFSESFEYAFLKVGLSNLKHFKKEIQPLYLPFTDFSDIQNSKAINLFLQVTSFPHYPEVINPHPFTVGTQYNAFSTADLLKASAQDSYYTQLLDQIIAEDLIAKHEPRLVGLSVVFHHQIIPAFQCAALLRKYWPHVHITLGGPCISTYFREIRAPQIFTLVDSLVRDEGEIPLERLWRALAAKQPDLSTVPGLSYAAGDTIYHNPPPPPLDIEQSPPPDYSVFNLARYLFQGNELFVPFRLSKGCPWQKCTFCRTNLPMCSDYQPITMERAYQQLLQVVNTTGLSLFMISDETADPEVLEYLSRRLLADQVTVHWFAHTRISKRLTRERCELFRQAGCLSLTLGVESFSNRILALMKKGITVELTEQVLQDIHGAVNLAAYMIVGFPTETEAEAFMSYQKLEQFLAAGLITKYVYNTFQIVYGSDMWNHPEQYGISEFLIPEGSDLHPNVYNFTTAEGMSRERARQLELQFNQRFEPSLLNFLVTEIEIDQTMVPARYDLRHLIALITENAFFETPFAQVLHKFDDKLYPTATRIPDE